MAFHFSLETLLRLRHSYERKERMRLEEVARRISAVKQRIADVTEERRAAASQQSRDLAAGLTASEMHFATACDAAREEQFRSLSNQLVELDKEYRQQQAVYLDARQKREILENLREGQAAEYKRDLDRREQRDVDDLFLMRSGRKLPTSPADVAPLPSA